MSPPLPSFLIGSERDSWSRADSSTLSYRLKISQLYGLEFESGRWTALNGPALKSMFEGIWIVGQAAEWDIAVTRRQVKSAVAEIKRENFRSVAEFRQFMRESHYTRRDVYERVEIQLLSTEVGARLTRQIERESRNVREEQRAFREFIDEFEDRWRGRTVCAPAYVIERCSNGPVPSAAGS